MAESVDGNRSVGQEAGEIPADPFESKRREIEPFFPIRADTPLCIKVFVDYHVVVELDPVDQIGLRDVRVSEVAGEPRFPILEEETGTHRLQENHVVIEQYEVFGKVTDAVQIQFDRIRVEGRQILLWHIILMVHQTEFRMILIEP